MSGLKFWCSHWPCRIRVLLQINFNLFQVRNGESYYMGGPFRYTLMQPIFTSKTTGDINNNIAYPNFQSFWWRKKYQTRQNEITIYACLNGTIFSSTPALFIWTTIFFSFFSLRQVEMPLVFDALRTVQLDMCSRRICVFNVPLFQTISCLFLRASLCF